MACSVVFSRVFLFVRNSVNEIGRLDSGVFLCRIEIDLELPLLPGVRQTLFVFFI